MMTPTIRRLFFGMAASLGLTATTGPAMAETNPERALATTVETLASRLDARIGVMITDSASGWTWAHGAHERFLVASVFKSVLCGAVLNRSDGGTLSIADLCFATVGLSDNTAGNLLIDRVGGPQAVTWQALLLGDVLTPASRGQLVEWIRHGGVTATLVRASTSQGWVTHPGFDHLTPVQSEHGAIAGELCAGLAAISAKDFDTAMGLRLGLPAGSVERKVLAWAIAITLGTGAMPADIRQIARDLSGWPGQSAILQNFERAVLRAQPEHAQVTRVLGGRLPITDEGKVALAQAHLAAMQTDRAAPIIRPWWVPVELTDVDQSQYAAHFSSILDHADHKRRMDQLLYDNRPETAVLLARLADAKSLVDPDLWWNERRIISRDLLDLGAAHNAQCSAAQADAEFHAGWYALQFLDDPDCVRTHFANCLVISTLPINRSQTSYWLGRAIKAAGKSEAMTPYYQAAAAHAGTFYGQLARVKLDRTLLEIGSANSTAQDRSAFANYEPVQAIALLEDAGYRWRAAPIYNYLSQILSTPAQLGLLALRPETRGDFSHAPRIGKTAYNRGFSVEQLAFPRGAISGLDRSDLPIAYALARQKSGFQNNAISPAEARGLLQLMPDTAAAVALAHGLSYSSEVLIEDPDLNAAIGAAYFAEQRQRWGGSYILTLVAYNAGSSRVIEWIERFGDPQGLPLDEAIDCIECIPHPETRNYVMRTIENHQFYETRLSGRPLGIADDLVSGG